MFFTFTSDSIHESVVNICFIYQKTVKRILLIHSNSAYKQILCSVILLSKFCAGKLILHCTNLVEKCSRRTGKEYDETTVKQYLPGVSSDVDSGVANWIYSCSAPCSTPNVL